ncbi:hypothetical protein N7468_006216 [Penicillium chermesinum]|uniref:Uncharacterized protein n=1 Tax=Penicillium chermesinum TaxID=63820 RepID=A0A9W9TJE5_9EURO|nr:uncharacterized protein N7468_006216 [Penicillium chermesinum]KAJ5224991.1 hypothetical protein N7468_006216 [Penicillium chermesinum]
MIEDESMNRPYSGPIFPAVHYIFEDDDTDILTEAGLRSMDDLDMHSDDQDVDHDATSLLPPPVPGVQDNYVIVDIRPTTPETATAPSTAAVASGHANAAQQISSPVPSRSQPQYRIARSQSLSSGWQVLGSELVPAPTFENGDPSQSSSHGLMLKIRGADRMPATFADSRDKSLEDMIGHFSKRMTELRAIFEEANLEIFEGQQEEGDGQAQMGEKREEGEHGPEAQTELQG